MEHRYIDIEAHIRRAQEQRSQALSELLAKGWKKCARAVENLAQRLRHAHKAAPRTRASAIH